MKKINDYRVEYSHGLNIWTVYADTDEGEVIIGLDKTRDGAIRDAWDTIHAYVPKEYMDTA